MKRTFHTIRVTSLDLPQIAPYRTLRRPVEHIRAGVFVAEGEKVVRRLLRSELAVLSLLVTPDWLAALEDSHELTTRAESGVEHSGDLPLIYIADHALVETIVGYNLHQGIMAVGTVPDNRSINEVLKSASPPHVIVALDGLVHAENTGVVVRNAAGFGAHAILVGETASSPYMRRAVRNSMGTVFSMPIVHSSNLPSSLREVKRMHASTIVAAHPGEGISVYEADLSGNLCLVFGNEGEGISPAVLEACDVRVAIPMLNGTDSLNVASASAVFLFEAYRQRQHHFINNTFLTK